MRKKIPAKKAAAADVKAALDIGPDYAAVRQVAL